MPNIVSVVGNLTRDPELRTVNTRNGSSSVCKIGLADNYYAGGETKVQFWTIEIWGKKAENCHKYLKKGSQITAFGNFIFEKWKNAQGVEGTTLKLNASEVVFGSKSGNSSERGDAYEEEPEQNRPARTQDTQRSSSPRDQEDDLPF